jgi:hypothetical protein
VLAGAAVVIEALALGLVGLGSSPVVLPLAAGATWWVARRNLPTPRPRPRAELAAWWRRLSPRAKLGVGALAGAAIYLVAWTLFHPYISLDAAIYHDPEVATWVQSGEPGSVAPLSYDFPFGNYPVTDEVLLTWGSGIARSWVPVALWPFAAMSVCAVAGWAGLRTLRVPKRYAAAALGAVVTLPWLFRQLNEVLTDLPVLAWATATAALCAGVRRRPALLPIALVGAGLAIGTKTTPIVPVAVALVAAAVVVRPRLRRIRRWLAVSALAAFLVGGTWYLRNLLDHGSPFWPFVRLPGADPIPPIIDLSNDPLVGRVSETIDGHVGAYLARIAGGIVLLVAAPVFMLLVRRRAVVVAGATAIVGFFAWTRAPGTGITHSNLVLTPEGTALSETRYLVPVFATSALTLALAAREGGRRIRAAAGLVLVAAIVWNVVRLVQLPHGVLPPILPVLGVAAAGALVLLALRGLSGGAVARPRARLPRGAWAGALLAVLAALVIAPAGSGWTKRTRKLARRRGERPARSALVRRRRRARRRRADRVRRLGHGRAAGGRSLRPPPLARAAAGAMPAGASGRQPRLARHDCPQLRLRLPGSGALRSQLLHGRDRPALCQPEDARVRAAGDPGRRGIVGHRGPPRSPRSGGRDRPGGPNRRVYTRPRARL